MQSRVGHLQCTEVDVGKSELGDSMLGKSECGILPDAYVLESARTRHDAPGDPGPMAGPETGTGGGLRAGLPEAAPVMKAEPQTKVAISPVAVGR